MALALPAALRAKLAAWSADEHPREACGLLLGWRDGDAYRVTRACSATNIAPEPRTRRYEVEPADLLRADQQARAAGLELVGVWHSHPDRSARPSERDLRGAYAGWAYLILGAGDELRAWHLRSGELVELSLAASDLSAARVP